MLQFCVSLLSPLHSAPPCLGIGLEQERTLVFIPNFLWSLQVLEQLDHFPHVDQSPSMAVYDVMAILEQIYKYIAYSNPSLIP